LSALLTCAIPLACSVLADPMSATCRHAAMIFLSSVRCCRMPLPKGSAVFQSGDM
jgi:hypothetical protein